MTIDLGNGKSVTVNSFQGQTWLTVSANGGGTTVSLGTRGMETAGEIIASERKVRRQTFGLRSASEEESACHSRMPSGLRADR